MPNNPYAAYGLRDMPLPEPDWTADPAAQRAGVWRAVLRGRPLARAAIGPRDARCAAQVQADGEVDGAMVRPFLAEQLTWEPLPHLRVVHRYGVVATFELKVRPSSPYTGVFEPFEESLGIMRYAVAHPTWGRHPLQLGIALKLFRQNRPPANILFNSLYVARSTAVGSEADWCQPECSWSRALQIDAQSALFELFGRPISTAPADPRLTPVPNVDAAREVYGTLGAFDSAALTLGNPQGLYANRVTLLDTFRAGPNAVFGRPPVPYALELEHDWNVKWNWRNRTELDLRARLKRMTDQDDPRAMPTRLPWATVHARLKRSDAPVAVADIYRTSAFISSALADLRLRFPHSISPDPDHALAVAPGCTGYMAALARMEGCPVHAQAPTARRPEPTS